MSWTALTALVGSPWVSRVMISTLRPLTPPAALISAAANRTPRLKPTPGAELGPVSAASHPMRIGSLEPCASAGGGKPFVASPIAPAVPTMKPRRVMDTENLPGAGAVGEPKDAGCWRRKIQRPGGHASAGAAAHPRGA